MLKKTLSFVIAILFSSLFLFSSIPMTASAEDNPANNVVFAGDPDASISQDLYINVKNLSTGETHIIYLYQLNNYQQFTYLPEGNYKIVEGGKINDVTNFCKVEYKEFAVEGENTLVGIKFGENVKQETKETVVHTVQQEVEIAPIEISEAKSYNSIFITVGALVFLVVICFVTKTIINRIKNGGI